MKYLILLLFCLSVGSMSGQMLNNIAAGGPSYETANSELYQTLSSVKSVREKKVNNMDAVGSPYLYDDFILTNLYYNDSLQGKIFYRYNAYNQEIEVQPNSIAPVKNINALKKDKNISILVDEHKMSFKTFVTNKNKTINGYLISLVKGEKYDLYKRVHVLFSLGRKSPNSFVQAVPNKLTHFTDYYIQKKGVNRIDPLNLRNRKLLKLVKGDKKEALKSYLKENDLNIKNEADLIDVFGFLNK